MQASIMRTRPWCQKQTWTSIRLPSLRLNWWISFLTIRIRLIISFAGSISQACRVLLGYAQSSGQSNAIRGHYQGFVAQKFTFSGSPFIILNSSFRLSGSLRRSAESDWSKKRRWWTRWRRTMTTKYRCLESWKELSQMGWHRSLWWCLHGQFNRLVCDRPADDYSGYMLWWEVTLNSLSPRSVKFCSDP